MPSFTHSLPLWPQLIHDEFYAGIPLTKSLASLEHQTASIYQTSWEAPLASHECRMQILAEVESASRLRSAFNWTGTISGTTVINQEGSLSLQYGSFHRIPKPLEQQARKIGDEFCEVRKIMDIIKSEFTSDEAELYDEVKYCMNMFAKRFISQIAVFSTTVQSQLILADRKQSARHLMKGTQKYIEAIRLGLT